MKKLLVYPAGTTRACLFASGFLSQSGIAIVDHPTPEVTHLLLDVPIFPGGAAEGKELLRMLPQEITVVGGNLDRILPEDYKRIDLLKDEGYLTANAAITAQCALQVAASGMESVFAGTPVLVIGWGRIGKCLARLLRGMGANVAVAARKEADRGMLRALGYDAVDMGDIQVNAARVVFNTVPAKVLSREQRSVSRNCLLIDLASVPGIEGEDVLWARGLPGRYAPESSGRLIAQTFLRRCKEEFE